MDHCLPQWRYLESETRGVYSYQRQVDIFSLHSRNANKADDGLPGSKLITLLRPPMQHSISPGGFSAHALSESQASIVAGNFTGIPAGHDLYRGARKAERIRTKTGTMVGMARMAVEAQLRARHSSLPRRQ